MRKSLTVEFNAERAIRSLAIRITPRSRSTWRRRFVRGHLKLHSLKLAQIVALEALTRNRSSVSSSQARYPS